MITLEKNDLVFRFPEVHKDATLTVNLQRTLRIPDDNRKHHLPPGFGAFPLSHIDDHADRVPEKWKERGGVMMPMYQAEALWMWFWSRYPFAIKVAAGKIDAVSGKSWSAELTRDPQNYLVIPDQPWLDGFNVGKGTIRQFVAMPLGQGYTAEEQLTGAAEHGGLQILAFPMKAEAYEKYYLPKREDEVRECMCLAKLVDTSEMGLAPGGLMRQEIYRDRYGLAKWDTTKRSRCFVHIVNSLQYRGITGANPPGEPPTAREYTAAGLPWFDYYDDKLDAVQGSLDLAGLDSVAAKGVKKGEKPLPENEPVAPANVKVLKDGRRVVREGGW